MIRRIAQTVCLVSCVVVAGIASAGVRYVKPTATGLGDCTSWSNACALETAIGPPMPVAQEGDEVWVKAGTYPPFVLLDGVRVYGGFAGTETSASQSNPLTNVTIVEGGGTQRCVFASGTGPGTVLRGFTIRNGYEEYYGGGLALEHGEASFVQCTFEYNTAGVLAGAAATLFSVADFTNCTFRYNGSTDPDDPPYGGGAAIFYFSSVTLVNCLFHDNQAWEGGAVEFGDQEVTFINCTFANNRATGPYKHGGAVFDDGRFGNFQNCIFWGNTLWNGTPESIYGDNYANGTIVTYSDIEGGWYGAGNINADPLFVDAAARNFQLSSQSPCKNTGSNALLPLDEFDLDWDGRTDGTNGQLSETIPKDLAMSLRKKNPVGSPIVDMGAYERQIAGEE